MMAYRSDPDANSVTQANFLDAMKTIKPSVDDEVIRFYENLSKNMGKSVREKRKQVEETGLYN